MEYLVWTRAGTSAPWYYIYKGTDRMAAQAALESRLASGNAAKIGLSVSFGR